MPGLVVRPIEPEAVAQRQLFGGSITCTFPVRFQDASDIQDVPSNLEVFVDRNTDENIIVEILDLKDEMDDQSSASWFLEDVASEQDAEEDMVVEAAGNIPICGVPFMDPSTISQFVVSRLSVPKIREGVEVFKSARVYLANMRLHNVQTDLVVTVYQPLGFSEQSLSAAPAGVVGNTMPAECVGCMTVTDIFCLVLQTFKIEDWGLFE